jgi:hypothetical protein
VFTNAHFAAIVTCDSGDRFRSTIDFTGQLPIGSDHRFQYDNTVGELAGSSIRGQLDTSGNASGTLVLKDSFDYEGTRYTCGTTTEWTAKLQR